MALLKIFKRKEKWFQHNRDTLERVTRPDPDKIGQVLQIVQ
jgi:hypothetical protein